MGGGPPGLSNMCQGSMHDLLRLLPKCEHHMHLEGALTPQVLFQLAKRNGIALPADDPAFETPDTLVERYHRFDSLDDFLHYYYIGMDVLVHAADFEALATDYFEHAAADGVAHAEVFFDPQAHLSRGVTYDTILAGFTAAQHKAEAQWDITSELICCFLRHLPASDGLQTFERPAIQQSLTDGTVIGIGLDSSEASFPPERFRPIYDRAGDMGVRRTAHAGEEGPADYIRRALDDLHVDRIDHGIRLIEDASLLQRVAQEGILLTVCPISNVFLRCVTSVAELPIRQFLDRGVRFSLNSDDPAYFGGHYILDNYRAVQDAFHLTVDEWTTVCEGGVRGSWCSEGRKAEILAKLETVVEDWKKKKTSQQSSSGGARIQSSSSS
ncbi:adenine deaminase-like [Teratosphaeria destructans]|uniref:Adenine deaminase n=1 Tax=Teratosphaeria destructans TaxID=418781 RepID=A0A9W7ST94_9PEZI|nr:adenine deaminase-like [Teratosphaeria destructans]